MSRNLKALGLALVACLALSGVAAVAAQAETHIESTLAAPAVTTLDVKNDTNEHGKLARLTVGNGARFIECTVIHLKEQTPFVGKTTTIEGTPEFTECFSNGLTSAVATVTHNGCKLKVTLTNAAPDATAHVSTSNCVNVIVHIYENQAADTANKPLCVYSIPAQTVSGGVVKNAGGAGTAMDLTAELAKSGKLTNITNSGPGGLAVCGIAAGGKGEGAFTGNLTITGTTSVGAAAGVTFI